MEIFIYMKSPNEDGKLFENPYMNNATSSSNVHFIAEIRESGKEKIYLLHDYAHILLKKLNTDGSYSIESTKLGFKLKKKITVDDDYNSKWDSWVEFSKVLHEELESFFEYELS